MVNVTNTANLAFKSLAFGAVLAVVACSPVFQNHGYVPPPEDLEQIKVGVDTRETVLETVGAPSSSGVLRDSGFYYVASRVRTSGARRPKVVSRELVAVSFDQRGVVSNIERFGLEDGYVIVLERRVTDSNVEDKGFLRQLLGNIGNFNPANIPGIN